MKTNQQLKVAGATEIEILKAEIEALWEIVESLPVDPHDMEVHFWCTNSWCQENEEEE